MKHFRDLNYYELLEIPQEATFSRIEASFQLAKRTYKEKSMATHSLFTEEELKEIWTRMDEAHRVLTDVDRRRSYDIFLASGSASPDPWKPSPISEPAAPIHVPEEVSGSFLKEVREKRRLTLQEVAASTRVAITYLTAIEDEKYAHLPPEVYVKGYLRDYAKALKLDAQKVIDGFLRHLKTPPHSWKK